MIHASDENPCSLNQVFSPACITLICQNLFLSSNLGVTVLKP